MHIARKLTCAKESKVVRRKMGGYVSTKQFKRLRENVKH